MTNLASAGAEQRHTILVVDDDADARLVMRAALRKAGFDVRTACGGVDALRQFRAAPCDLVMLDVDMPDLGGHEVCAMLRAEAGPLLPIVMVTGMDDVGSVETAYEQGATDFIAKPVNWALVGHRVRYLLRGREALLSLQAAEARNAAILNAIPDFLFELDIDGRCIECRLPPREVLPMRSEQIVGRRVADVMPPAAAALVVQALRGALANGLHTGVQLELPHGMPFGGNWYELSVARKTVRPGQKPSFIVLSRDITERKQAEASIARLAYYDSLTGLPNRRSFLERVDAEVRLAWQHKRRLAVLFMDLDGFKDVNDGMGHAAGDLILQWAAERLRDALRPADLLSRPISLDDGGTVTTEDGASIDLARLGGDEFTALIQDVQSADDAYAVAQRIGQLMRQPFVIDGHEVTLTTSIGIALFPDDGRDGATLLKHADTAMYAAKRSGRDNAQLYSAALTREVVQRIELDAQLRTALDRDQFHMVYQPQIDLKTGRVQSVEALIRWTHPQRGEISPLEFIPLAEDNGMIGRIGHWALRTACAAAARWAREGAPVRVAVNLSPLQIAGGGLPELVMAVLDEAGLPPQRLELEVTEGALMENSAATRDALQTLRDRGVQIALDDFGTGYSSLAYLTRMPIGHIKVDRCFVAGLLDGGESVAIIRAVLAMARSLGMRVTAEGIETREQARALAAMACDCLQGFFFSRPVAADAVPALLRRRWTVEAGGDATAATHLDSVTA